MPPLRVLQLRSMMLVLLRVPVWQVVKSVMIEAGNPDTPHRKCKGLQHGYGINAVLNGVSLNMLRKRTDHESIESTAIHADAVGKEEQDVAARMWD